MSPSVNRWGRRRQALATLLPRDRLHPQVTAWAAGDRGRGPWGIGLSGGADSLAVLLLVSAHWPRRRLVALHFNHRLRGREANADESFCRRVCAALDIPFISARWKSPPVRASEGEARAARFAFFDVSLRAARGRALWLGHHRDDVAETLLMRLGRGSGSAGLAAPRPLQHFAGGRVHLRPLLNLDRAEIESALITAGIAWRCDASNSLPLYLRNRIRSRVIPVWRKAVGERDPVAGAALTRELLQEDDDALEAWVARLAPIRPDGSLDLRRLSAAPSAVRRRALHRWLRSGGREPTLSRQGFAALLAVVESGRATRFSLGAGEFAVVRHGLMRVSREGRSVRRRVKLHRRFH